MRAWYGSPENAGALGAKLTGAGRGGAIIALADDKRSEIVQALNNAGYDALSTEILPYRS